MINQLLEGHLAVGRPKGRSGAETRARLIDAALDRFARDGFHNVGVRAIARDVGVTDAAVFRHFGSKRGLLQAVFEAQGITSALERLERESPSGARAAVLARMEADAWRLMRRNTALVRLVTGEALRGDPDALAVFQEFMERWTEAATQALARTRSREPRTEAEEFVRRVFGDFVQDELLGAGHGQEQELRPRRSA